LTDEGESVEVFATVQSVTGTESHSARTNGIRASSVFVVWSEEYSGQREILHNGQKLTVYRVYERRDDKTELYAEKRAGKWHGNKG
jgi:hypothetical protein